MLLCVRNNALVWQELCSGGLKAMLWMFESIALQGQELCSPRSKAMLYKLKSYAFVLVLKIIVNSKEDVFR